MDTLPLQERDVGDPSETPWRGGKTDRDEPDGQASAVCLLQRRRELAKRLRGGGLDLVDHQHDLCRVFGREFAEVA